MGIFDSINEESMNKNLGDRTAMNYANETFFGEKKDQHVPLIPAASTRTSYIGSSGYTYGRQALEGGNEVSRIFRRILKSMFSVKEVQPVEITVTRKKILKNNREEDGGPIVPDFLKKY